MNNTSLANNCGSWVHTYTAGVMRELKTGVGGCGKSKPVCMKRRKWRASEDGNWQKKGDWQRAEKQTGQNNKQRSKVTEPEQES